MDGIGKASEECRPLRRTVPSERTAGDGAGRLALFDQGAGRDLLVELGQGNQRNRGFPAMECLLSSTQASELWAQVGGRGARRT